MSTQKPRPPGRRPNSRPFPSGAQGRTPPRDGDRGHRPPPPPPDTVYLWGTHAVVEALGSLRRKALRISATEAAVERIAELAADRGVPVSIVPGDAISARLPRDAVHQGLLLEARRLEPIALDALPDDGVVLVLDQITDPHNVGAILRTAAAFGVSALVLQDRHAPDLSGTLAKAASGGLEHVPVALVVNLARTLDKLGERGFFRVGLDSAGDGSLEAMDLPRPLALVLGSEGDGLRRLTRERCDAVARLDMPGPIKSLNVSIACAVALTVARLKAPAQ
ncbi:23S rRNA (guanosine(2251)-2'-O)-methyltransferase RlmB [Lichenibacterium minor]|uniref:23S rRNA (Guanosine(2251)-2'-O)-methyltransferase RlmB n=1 Tax=Lichenibacterium minor TaxID=2316528 RepID=A0A4Q2U8U7_9HYPH|nr:23S rRNA (guanosine(2251)-2'-O)-methyltransferase RlmB [Lichenibacterium minor]RYC31517.1 23S rRNA (guanosine(2251)-2'-O)-methyltransferase RlmB [Lichenibacterium minor]